MRAVLEPPRRRRHAGGHGALHGRGPECATLARVLAAARDDRSAALVLHGAAGIGKTALLHHTIGKAADLIVLRATGVEAELQLPYAGLHQLLWPVLGHSAELAVPQAKALRAALGTAAGGHEPFAVCAAVLSLLAALADRRPVLLVVDDLQWLDRASAVAITFAVRRLQVEPVAAIIACRTLPDDVGGLPSLHVDRLGADGASALLAAALPDDAPPHVRRQLLALADGNPLALRELPSRLSPDQLAGRAAMPDPVPVTTTITRAFLHRVEPLHATTRTLLQVASAERLGDVDLVLRAGAGLGCGRSSLVEAESAGLLDIVDDRLRFRHPLVRSAVLSSATGVQRRAAHAALAGALQAAADRDRKAWHRAAATLGRDDEVAWELERSADRAVRRSGLSTAADALERAAELSSRPADVVRRLLAAAHAAWGAGEVDRVQALVDRAMPLADEPATLADIQLLRGLCERVVGTTGRAYDILLAGAADAAPHDPGRALAMATIAVSVAWSRNDGARVQEAAVRVAHLAAGRADADVAEALAVRSFAAAFGGETTAAVAIADRATAAAERGGGPQELSVAGAAALFVGDDGACMRLLGRAAATARSRGSVATLITVLAPYAVAESWTGHLRSARAHASEGLALAQQTGHTTDQALYQAALAWISAAAGDHVGCEQLAVPAARGGLEQEFAPATAIAAWARGLSALGDGRPDEAYAHLAELVHREVRTSHPIVSLAATGDIVETSVAAGAQATAVAALADLERFAAGTGRPWAYALAARGRALLGDADDAEPDFRAALAHHARGSRPFEHGRTLLAYGSWLRRQRRRVDARRQLRVALQVFERLGTRDWEDRVRRELRASGAPVGRSEPSGLGTLTPQELQVVELVRTGATNKQIAARLYLSPRTIDYHLRKVFVKLGLSSRAELIALPYEDLTPSAR